jgi:hypothetical protein
MGEENQCPLHASPPFIFLKIRTGGAGGLPPAWVDAEGGETPHSAASGFGVMPGYAYMVA